MKNEMGAVRLPPCLDAEPAFPDDLQHGGVLRKNIGDQRLEPGTTRDVHEVAHKHRADALSLVRIVDGEGTSAWPEGSKM